MTNVSPELLDLLVCPSCHAAVSEQSEGIVCSGCGRVYPIVDGIPVMLIERSRPRE